MRFVALAMIVFAWMGCAPAAAETVRVFAAASLKTAVDRIVARWQSSAGHEAIAVYAASSALAKQIEEGAPADLFISADLAWMDEIEKQGLIRPGSRSNLLGNRLALIAPKGSGLRIELKPGVDLLPYLAGGRLAAGEINAVPAGRYAKAALEHLGLWESLEPHLAQQVNVRAALQFVSRGEAPLGIVYASDVIADASVEVVAMFPAESHPPIVYPVALVAASNNPWAEEFLRYLRSPEASRHFQDNGFTVLD